LKELNNSKDAPSVGWRILRALILGFMTRFFSAALMVLTIVAIAAVHWPAEWHTPGELWQGYTIIDKGHGNFKLPLVYLFMLGSLLLSGSGRIGVDAWLKRRAA
jgi:putative oxidoreductase